ncbi:MAG: adenylate/guanylate cyclase domain-containing protein [Fuerstiella sp.]
MQSFRVSVYHSGIPIKSLTFDSAIVVGRRDPLRNDPPPVAMHDTGGDRRLIVADMDLRGIPRSWFEVTPEAEKQFTICNVQRRRALILGIGEFPKQDVGLENNVLLSVGESRRFDGNVVIDLGSDIAVQIEPVVDDENDAWAYRSLQSVPPTPGQQSILVTRTIGEFADEDAEDIAKMLRLALQVVQESAGSDSFFQAAVAATTEIVDLDRAVMLLRNDAKQLDQMPTSRVLSDEWREVAQHTSSTREIDATRIVSTTLLRKVVDSCSTVIHDPTQKYEARSLCGVESAVASPILNNKRQVVGVLYGDRGPASNNRSRGNINDLEATLVEILAGAVAGGIARRSEERFRAALSQFFSPKVANLLSTDPKLMDGQDAEISVLFCDIRGFTSVTEQIGPKMTIEWINDVMSELSQCVIDRDGVLVDYVGDELLAMWGVPGEQPDHAARAIETAQAMLHAIEVLRSRWKDSFPQRFAAGIGINTGPARVGNVGSRQKFKYGPLGNTVNLASRLQSATKQLGVDCIAGIETVRAAEYADRGRRLAKIAVVGIESPLDVYEINREAGDQWGEFANAYQSALADFENKRFDVAAKTLGTMLPRYPDDRPSRLLLSHVMAELDAPSNDFTGVWKLTAK